MFERFTERAREVCMISEEFARMTMGHQLVGTEHLLYGLAAVEGVGAYVLNDLGIGPHDVEVAVEKVCGRLESARDDSRRLPFTPRSKKVLELALREALSLGANYIGTEHILLGLSRETEGVGAQILREREINGETIRNEVIRHLTQGKSGRQIARDRHQYLAIITIDEVEVGPTVERLEKDIRALLEDLPGPNPRTPSVIVVHLDPATKLAQSPRHSQRR